MPTVGPSVQTLWLLLSPALLLGYFLIATQALNDIHEELLDTLYFCSLQ